MSDSHAFSVEYVEFEVEIMYQMVNRDNLRNLQLLQVAESDHPQQIPPFLCPEFSCGSKKMERNDS